MIWVSVKDDLLEIEEKVLVWENRIYYFDMIKKIPYGHHCKSWTHGDPEYWTRDKEFIAMVEKSWQ